MRAPFVYLGFAVLFGCHRKPDADPMCERLRRLASASHLGWAEYRLCAGRCSKPKK